MSIDKTRSGQILTRDDGGPAFPLTQEQSTIHDGMSLRDWFAGQSISGTLPGGRITDDDVAKYAEWAYRMADAMLKEREKS